jgi:hypothetical protein
MKGVVEEVVVLMGYIGRIVSYIFTYYGTRT